MAEINWTKEAEIWLQDIYDYISEDNPQAADRVVTAICEKVELLSQFPKIGYQYNKELNHNIRILLFGHYRIAYLIKSDENIDILGIYHSSMDFQRYLI